jgi:tripartite-type tricarboxylate transporter receptor subunit TctC
VLRMLSAALVGLFALMAPATAQERNQERYPNRPIKIVVPLTAGSPVDVTGRLVGNYLSAALRQPVVIENRPGAGATIGAKAVATAEPDGYTLLHTAANHVIAASALKNLSYDPLKDFAPIGATANVLASAEVKASMAKLGLIPKIGSPQQFLTFLEAERRDWSEPST